MTTLFTGPVFTDSSGTANTGSALDAQDLNVYVVAQSFWMNPSTATPSTMTVTFGTTPEGVVNTGTSAVFVVASSTSLTITGGHGSAQDYYIYLTSTGAYTTVNVAAGTGYTVNGNLGALLARATTNSADSSISVVTTSVAITVPFGSTGMNTSGSNASSPVAFPGALTVATTLGVTGLTSLSTLSTSGLATLASLDVTGNLTVGSVTLTGWLKYSVPVTSLVLTPGEIYTPSFTVAGAAVGNTILASYTNNVGSVPAGLVVNAFITGANTIEVHFANLDSYGITVPTGQVNIQILQD